MAGRKTEQKNYEVMRVNGNDEAGDYADIVSALGTSSPAALNQAIGSAVYAGGCQLTQHWSLVDSIATELLQKGKIRICKDPQAPNAPYFMKHFHF